MECLCKDTSNMLLFLCPAQLSGCSTPITLTALSLSHHFLPTCSSDPPGLYSNGCPVSWKMQNSHWTQNQKDSGILMLLQLKQPQWKQEKHPNACSREPCTQILLPPLQLGGVRSSGLGQTEPLAQNLCSSVNSAVLQHPAQRPSRSDFQDKKQLMLVWAAQPHGGAEQLQPVPCVCAGTGWYLIHLDLDPRDRDCSLELERDLDLELEELLEWDLQQHGRSFSSVWLAFSRATAPESSRHKAATQSESENANPSCPQHHHSTL